MDKRLRVVLADDHEVVLEGLRALLANEPDLQVIATATNGTDVLAALERCQPDVVVLDLQMPVSNGPSCLAEIRRRRLPVGVLVLTAFSDGESLRSAIESGADGVTFKTASPQQTIQAIRQVGQGYLVFPHAARKWLRGLESDPGPGLSEREWQVLEQVARGLSNTQIAQALNVSENTVKFHLQNIFQKLGVNNRIEAARIYFRTHGEPPSAS